MPKIIFIWTTAILFSAMAGAAAFGSIAKQKAPELALSLFPTNGFAAERVASEPVKFMIAENSGQFPKEISQKSIDLARQAFEAEPITPQAIAVIALGSENIRTLELMSAALSLSRREQLVTGWMIVDSAAQKDIPEILEYYDTMLRTSSSAGSVVIPVMANAIANDNFIAPFANLLAKKPPWASQFWATVAGMPGSLANAARLRESLYNPKESDDAYRDSDLVIALVNDRQFEEAKGLYSLLVDQKRHRSIMENALFEHEPLYPPLDWQLFSTGEYGSVIKDGKLQLSAISNSGGLFARQLVKLPFMIIELEVKSHKTIDPDSQIIVNLTCAESNTNAPLPVRIPITSNITKQKVNNQQSECQYYWLNVFGRSVENSDGFDASLDYIKINI